MMMTKKRLGPFGGPVCMFAHKYTSYLEAKTNPEEADGKGFAVEERVLSFSEPVLTLRVRPRQTQATRARGWCPQER